jgi:hypothetical protein
MDTTIDSTSVFRFERVDKAVFLTAETMVNSQSPKLVQCSQCSTKTAKKNFFKKFFSFMKMDILFITFKKKTLLLLKHSGESILGFFLQKSTNSTDGIFAWQSPVADETTVFLLASRSSSQHSQ